jgi:glycosyltransferase involved in cell wall biosynthesis
MPCEGGETGPIQSPRILFCPHEIGGQMQLMVQELRRRGIQATAATYSQEWFGHVNDVHLDLQASRGRIRRQLLAQLFSAWAALNYDVFHFFWGESLYGFGRFQHLDLPVLRWLGRKVFVHFRGLDVIDLKHFDYLRSKTAGDAAEEPPLSRPEQTRSVRTWTRYANKMLVSEPDLFRAVPGAVLIQQAVDLDAWSPSGKTPRSLDDGIIRIAHAPSMRRKKGTEFVERSVEELKREGHAVELVLIEKVPFQRVKSLYEQCDLGIDQVLYGWYGKVSIELMALGIPAVCYIDPKWAHYRPDCPIINGHPDALTQVLRQLVKDQQLRVELGRRGRLYVERYHDVRVIINQCLTLYEGGIAGDPERPSQFRVMEAAKSAMLSTPAH